MDISRIKEISSKVEANNNISTTDYTNFTRETAIYPKCRELEYVTLGLVGESGEIANKVKKVIRDDGGIITNEKIEDLKCEVGDVCWYIARLCDHLGTTIDEVLTNNVKKLSKRCIDSKITGSGDNR
jgi:NTP pyrophosphatase (non-canonical NTP hydrolase)